MRKGAGTGQEQEQQLVAYMHVEFGKSDALHADSDSRLTMGQHKVAYIFSVPYDFGDVLQPPKVPNADNEGRPTLN